jgi:hypothetical protein
MQQKSKQVSHQRNESLPTVAGSAAGGNTTDRPTVDAKEAVALRRATRKVDRTPSSINRIFLTRGTCAQRRDKTSGCRGAVRQFCKAYSLQMRHSSASMTTLTRVEAWMGQGKPVRSRRHRCSHRNALCDAPIGFVVIAEHFLSTV